MKKTLLAVLAVSSVGFVACERFPIATITFDKQITRVGDVANGTFEFNLNSYYSDSPVVLSEFTDPKNSLFLVFCDQKAFGGGIPASNPPSNACIRNPEQYPIAEQLMFINPVQNADRHAPSVKVTVDPKTNTITQAFSIKAMNPTESQKPVVIVMQLCRLLDGQTDFNKQAECPPLDARFGFFIAQ
jgi:hypothetical protein